jgi:hypothetical protein
MSNAFDGLEPNIADAITMVAVAIDRLENRLAGESSIDLGAIESLRLTTVEASEAMTAAVRDLAKTVAGAIRELAEAVGKRPSP